RRPLPKYEKMLFRGGPAKALATDDLRMGREDDLPRTGEMLSDGGEAGDGTSEISGAAIAACEDLIDALGGGFGYGATPSEDDTKVEREVKTASREARARVVAEALKALFLEFYKD